LLRYLANLVEILRILLFVLMFWSVEDVLETIKYFARKLAIFTFFWYALLIDLRKLQLEQQAFTTALTITVTCQFSRGFVSVFVW
jgi:hypothetical protein